jgi:hypothetical protein
MATRLAAVSLGVLLAVVAALPAQAPGGFNVIVPPPKVNVQDKEDVWVLNFQFKGPRVFTTDIPGRGKKTVWYVWYQVWNLTGQPRDFIPDFELLTNLGTLHRDEVLPKVQEEIAQKEGVPGFDTILNTTTIGLKPIPVTKPEANPAYVTGLAIFPDVVEKAPATTSFTIFVSGLSNGWQEGPQGITYRKTLQLNFARAADANAQNSQVIRYLPPNDWIYRGTGVNAPVVKPAVTKDGGER